MQLDSNQHQPGLKAGRLCEGIIHKRNQLAYAQNFKIWSDPTRFELVSTTLEVAALPLSYGWKLKYPSEHKARYSELFMLKDG